MPLFIDIETNGLLDEATKVHCIRAYDSEARVWHRFDAEHQPIEIGVKLIQDSRMVVGHNIIAFDIPVLQKLYPDFKPPKILRDTLVLARLIYGDIKNYDYSLWRRGALPGNLIGTHSLKAWGYRIGVLKGTYGETTDWAAYTREMGDYCERDVEVVLALWDHLCSRKHSPAAVELEHQVQAIAARIERFGFPFDIDAAERLYVKLKEEKQAVEREAASLFPPFYRWDGKIFSPKRDNARLGYHAGGECCRVSLTQFSPTSNQHVYYYLRKKYGWEPTEFTEKSILPRQWMPLFSEYYRRIGVEGFPEPKIDETILSALPYPEAPILARAALLQKRIGQLAEGKKAWIKLYNPKTKAIHGSYNTLGTVTRRMAHFDPNIAQVPANNAPYGEECRALFGCYGPRSSWMQVGVDASSLEMMMLAHYLHPYDGGEFLKSVSEGKQEDGTDPHSRNAAILGLSRRDAKTWFYGWCYGAGDEKLGKIAGRDKAYGKKMRKKFLASVPGFSDLLKAIQVATKKRGYLLSIDGHPLPIRSEHSALNTLLQSAGAIVMKKALVILDANLQYIWKPSEDYEFVGLIHDEFQILVAPTADPEFVGQAAVDAITAAGEALNLRCRLTGEYRIGKNWKECH